MGGRVAAGSSVERKIQGPSASTYNEAVLKDANMACAEQAVSKMLAGPASDRFIDKCVTKAMGTGLRWCVPHEASAAKINADVRASLDQFFRQTPGARELANNAAGVLVFPTVVKAGFGIGGEYGKGALLVGGRPVGYYNLVSASFGFQLGAQARTVIIMFMTPSALAGFNRTAGWKVGVDGSVTLITLGAGASIDTNQITSPVIGFVLDPTGLMYNLTLEGSKISRINP